MEVDTKWHANMKKSQEMMNILNYQINYQSIINKLQEQNENQTRNIATYENGIGQKTFRKDV